MAGPTRILVVEDDRRTPWRRRGWERERLRRRLRQRPHPEVHEHRDLRHQVGQLWRRERAVRRFHWRRRGWERARLRRRTRQRTYPEVRMPLGEGASPRDDR